MKRILYLLQMFTVVVTELETGLVLRNVTALIVPSFTLTGLRDEQECVLAVYASNPLGRSQEVVLQATTPKGTESPTDQARG